MRLYSPHTGYQIGLSTALYFARLIYAWTMQRWERIPQLISIRSRWTPNSVWFKDSADVIIVSKTSVIDGLMNSLIFIVIGLIIIPTPKYRSSYSMNEIFISWNDKAHIHNYCNIDECKFIWLNFDRYSDILSSQSVRSSVRQVGLDVTDVIFLVRNSAIHTLRQSV